jgi:hypothetical protein
VQELKLANAPSSVEAADVILARGSISQRASKQKDCIKIANNNYWHLRTYY